MFFLKLKKKISGTFIFFDYYFLNSLKRGHFYSFGEISEIKLVSKTSTCFVTYTTREAAEKAISLSYNNCVINDINIKIAWAKPAIHDANTEPKTYFTMPSVDASTATPTNYSYVPPNPVNAPSFYPSMNPQRLGSK
jgi:hypothetical protein